MSSLITASSIRFSDIVDWDNLLKAWGQAAKGKRRKRTVAAFEHNVADNLLALQSELSNGSYRPGQYTHFYIREPKLRKISAAPFRDRVVHHALCNILEPFFEQRFIPDSYANRIGKGTHRAVNRFQCFSRRYRYVLRMDIVKHFPSLDHRILYDFLCRFIEDEQVCQLIASILDSGSGIHEQHDQFGYFPGDDLFAILRPRGLPIGNLTSQFWSNCYMHPLDLHIKRELSCKGYLRYVDDFAVFSDSKQELWDWKARIVGKLGQLRLRIHPESAQVMPCAAGIPWLGFVIYPEYKRLKSRKVVEASRRLKGRFADWQQGKISFAEFDASVQGWVNHVCYADSWGLRKKMLRQFKW